MSTYYEKYQKAKQAEKTSHVTAEIHTWEKDGDMLIGKLIDIKPFEGGKYETSVNEYVIKTDDGIFTTILGSHTDSQIAVTVQKDCNIAITFKGKIQLGDGRSCNKFQVETF